MNRTCEVENCKVKAYFNFEGEKHGVRCAKHRIEGHINIYDKACAFETCKKRPLFNIIGQK